MEDEALENTPEEPINMLANELFSVLNRYVEESDLTDEEMFCALDAVKTKWGQQEDINFENDFEF